VGGIVVALKHFVHSSGIRCLLEEVGPLQHFPALRAPLCSRHVLPVGDVQLGVAIRERSDVADLPVRGVDDIPKEAPGSLLRLHHRYFEPSGIFTWDANQRTQSCCSVVSTALAS